MFRVRIISRVILVWGVVFGLNAATRATAVETEGVGVWKLTFSPGDGDHEATLTITKGNPGFRAEFSEGDRKFVVTKVDVAGDKLVVSTEGSRDGQKTTATFEGKIEGDVIKGTATWTYQGMSGSFSFDGKRDIDKSRQDMPTVVPVPGKPNLLLGNFDLAPHGYQIEEFFISGTASSFKRSEKAEEEWEVTPAGRSPYTTRIVVVRPSDAAKFSGAVMVEWLNVSGGFDMPVDWTMAHREMLRRGHAYVGVSAQKVGLEALKKADSGRYERLSHPGDSYSFDIFSQAGRVLKAGATNKVLGALSPQRWLAIGESQSAFYLTTYTASIDPLARVYDGILIHSRFGSAASLDNTSMLDSMLAAAAGPVNAAKLPNHLRVPVLTVITESDLVGWPPLNGYHFARQPDSDRLRVWEIAGTAHADNYIFGVGFIDSGSLPIEQLAAAYAPNANFFGQKLDQPMNFGAQHHYVLEAALWRLDRWVRTGEAAPSAPPLKLHEDKNPTLVTGENGLAEGGVRTPWVDVPTAVLSGVGGMVGFGKPFDAATLNRLYPGGKSDYLKRFEASLDSAIKTGFILPDDKQEILELAKINFQSGSETAESANQ